MRKFGLIGFPLSHSFSKGYFKEKFEKEKIIDAVYDNYEIEDISAFQELIKSIGPDLIGLNVTIPHKQGVMRFLERLDPAAQAIGAVNVIKFSSQGPIGYNSDYHGFRNSLLNLIGTERPNALILGMGGASKAVKQALIDLEIGYTEVSSSNKPGSISYEQATESFSDYRLIINTTPLGMHPNVDAAPDLPYDQIDDSYFLFDLIYNPRVTKFMNEGAIRGAKVSDGLEMLHLQAEKAWEIWNS